MSQTSEYFSTSLRIIAMNIGDRLENRYHQYCLEKGNDMDKVKQIRLYDL